MGQGKRSKKRSDLSHNRTDASTSSSEDEKKLKKTKGTKKRLSKKSMISNTSEYDGDCEESTEASTQQSDTSMKSIDLYDFQETDIEAPDTSSQIKKKQHLKSTKMKQTRIKDLKPNPNKRMPKKKKESESVSHTQESEVPQFPLGDNCIEIELVHEVSESERKNRSSQRSSVSVEDKILSSLSDVEMKPTDMNPSVKLTKIEITQHKFDVSNNKGQKRKMSQENESSKRKSIRIAQHGMQNESGFLSPPLPRRPAKTNEMKETSTPNVTRNPRDSCFGFESLTTAEPMLSPVRFTSPTSDYGSMMSSSAQSSTASRFDTSSWRDKSKRTYTRRSASLGKNAPEPILYDLSVADEKQKRVSKPKKKKEVLAKYEDWADKMNAEFEEIEMHELSIEG